MVHRYSPVGVKREPVGRLHRHPSTKDNATSLSKSDTVLKVEYLNRSSVDAAGSRSNAVAVAANRLSNI